MNQLREFASDRINRVAIAGLAIAALAFNFWRDVKIGVYRIPYTDFQSFYAAALAVRHHADPYGPALDFMKAYVASGNGTLFATKSYVYAPFFALLLSPLTLVSMSAALLAWDVLNVAFLVGAAYALMRSTGARVGVTWVLAIAGAASLWAAVRKEWYLGQSDVFILFLVSAALWARTSNRRNVAGVLLGVAIATKPAFAVLVPFLLWKREFRFALVSLGSGALLLAAPTLWLGPTVAAHQLQVWNFWSGPYVAFAHNDAPKGILTRLFTDNPVTTPLFVSPPLVTVTWLAISAGIAVLVLAVLRPAPFRREARSLIEFGLIIEAQLLIAPLTEWPYLLLMLVPLCGIIAWLLERRINDRAAWVAAVGALAVAGLLYGPANALEYWALDHVGGGAVKSAAFTLIAGANLYLIAGAFWLQLHALETIASRGIQVSVTGLLRDAPRLIRLWVADATRRPVPELGSAPEVTAPAASGS